MKQTAMKQIATSVLVFFLVGSFKAWAAQPVQGMWQKFFLAEATSSKKTKASTKSDAPKQLPKQMSKQIPEPQEKAPKIAKKTNSKINNHIDSKAEEKIIPLPEKEAPLKEATTTDPATKAPTKDQVHAELEDSNQKIATHKKEATHQAENLKQKQAELKQLLQKLEASKKRQAEYTKNLEALLQKITNLDAKLKTLNRTLASEITKEKALKTELKLNQREHDKKAQIAKKAEAIQASAEKEKTSPSDQKDLKKEQTKEQAKASAKPVQQAEQASKMPANKPIGPQKPPAAKTKD